MVKGLLNWKFLSTQLWLRTSKHHSPSFSHWRSLSGLLHGCLSIQLRVGSDTNCWLSQAPRSVGQPCGCVNQAKQDFVARSYRQQRDVAVTQHKETRKTFSKHFPLFWGRCHSGMSIAEGFSIWFTEIHKLLRIQCSQLKHRATPRKFQNWVRTQGKTLSLQRLIFQNSFSPLSHPLQLITSTALVWSKE